MTGMPDADRGQLCEFSPLMSAERETLRPKWANVKDRLCAKTHVGVGWHGPHVDATLLSWSNIGITVRIPRSDKFKPGNRYYVGISAEGDTRWLSNIDQTFRFQERR